MRDHLCKKGRTAGEISFVGSPFLQVLPPNNLIRTHKSLLRIKHNGLRLITKNHWKSSKPRDAHRNQQRRWVGPIPRHRITEPPFCTHFGQLGAQSISRNGSWLEGLGSGWDTWRLHDATNRLLEGLRDALKKTDSTARKKCTGVHLNPKEQSQPGLQASWDPVS